MSKLVGFKYIPQGICAKELTLVIDEEDKTIHEVSFVGGCGGNHLGIGALVNGMSIDDAMTKLGGIKCGGRDTSCPDQLSIALREVKNMLNKKNENE